MDRTTLFAAIAFAVLGASGVSADGLTGPQKNAARSAQQYIAMMGFSRDGLVQQLVIGDGYSAADAAAAVGTLSVDWNAQAAKSAQQYLAMMGFSCSGLIQQLQVGDQYTSSQATYGAQQAGAC